MELYQITENRSSSCVAIGWDKLPSSVMSHIPASRVQTVMAYGKESGMVWKSVVLFRKVNKFRKDINQIVVDNITFGV